jgi:signal transduction histidine kinase
LRPPAFDGLGLVASISKLLLDFSNRTTTKGYLKLVGEERPLLPDKEVGLFRIAQEALRNVALHSKASEMVVAMVFHGDDS